MLFDKNEFTLRVPDEPVRVPMQDIENQQPNTSAMSHYQTTPILQESVNENLTHNEFGKL